MLLHGPTAAAKSGQPLERALFAAGGALVATLATACGIILMVRRLGGGFEPPGGAGVLAGTLLGGLLVLACDAAVQAVRLPFAWRLVARGGYLLAVGALAVPPRLGTPFDDALLLVAAALGGGVVVGPLTTGRVRLWRAGLRPRAVTLPEADVRRATARAGALRSVPADAGPGHLLQRFERYELDGIDCLRGALMLTVPQGSRSAHGHVGFCPSFREMPQVETGTAYDGVEAVVTAAEIVPWGVRIECRLDEPADEAVEIPIDVHARARV